jgi:hypothetical protein
VFPIKTQTGGTGGAEATVGGDSVSTWSREYENINLFFGYDTANNYAQGHHVPGTWATHFANPIGLGGGGGGGASSGGAGVSGGGGKTMGDSDWIGTGIVQDPFTSVVEGWGEINGTDATGVTPGGGGGGTSWEKGGNGSNGQTGNAGTKGGGGGGAGSDGSTQTGGAGGGGYMLIEWFE